MSAVAAPEIPTDRLAGDAPAAWRRAWRSLQAQLVDRIKAAALLRLHQSARGEGLLFTTYLWGEEASEPAAIGAATVGAPAWLAAQLERHLADETRHAARLRDFLCQRGHRLPSAARVDPLSALKLRRLRRLVERSGAAFSAGTIVPALAVAQVMEEMAVRVLSRHVRVLAVQLPTHPSLPLLQAIAADEARHVQACANALARLTVADEQPALARVDERARAIERSFGISGAIGLWLAGVVLAPGPGPQARR